MFENFRLIVAQFAKRAGCWSLFLVASLLFDVPAAKADALQNAMQLYAQGSYGLALDQLHQAIAADPKNATAHYMSGNVLLQLNFGGEAIKEYEAAARLDPTGKTGNMSRQALATIRNITAPPPPAVQSPSGNTRVPLSGTASHARVQMIGPGASNRVLPSKAAQNDNGFSDLGANLCRRLASINRGTDNTFTELLTQCNQQLRKTRQEQNKQTQDVQTIEEMQENIKIKYRQTMDGLNNSLARDALVVVGAPEMQADASVSLPLQARWSKYESDLNAVAALRLTMLSEFRDQLSDRTEAPIVQRYVDQMSTQSDLAAQSCKSAFGEFVRKLGAL